MDILYRTYPVVALDIRFKQCYLDETSCQYWMILDTGSWSPDALDWMLDAGY
jgi:hypothetical protein